MACIYLNLNMYNIKWNCGKSWEIHFPFVVVYVVMFTSWGPFCILSVESLSLFFLPNTTHQEASLCCFVLLQLTLSRFVLLELPY